jgi:hypothetical protein
MATPLIEEGIYLLLTQSTTLMATLGANGVYLNTVPEGAIKPCLCISTVSSTPDETFDGSSAYNIRRYQFTAKAADYPSTKRVQEALRKLLDGYSGVLPAASGQTGVKVFNIIRDIELDSYDDQGNTHNAITDYFIHFAL